MTTIEEVRKLRSAAEALLASAEGLRRSAIAIEEALAGEAGGHIATAPEVPQTVPQTWDQAIDAGWLEPGRAAGLFGMTESWALKRARQGYGAKFGTGRWLIDVARLRADQA